MPLHGQGQGLPSHLTGICKCLREFQAKEVSLPQGPVSCLSNRPVEVIIGALLMGSLSI